MESDCWTEALFIILDGLQGHDYSSRDDNLLQGNHHFFLEKHKPNPQQNCHLDRSVVERSAVSLSGVPAIKKAARYARGFLRNIASLGNQGAAMVCLPCVIAALQVGCCAAPKGVFCTAESPPVAGFRASPDTVLARKLAV
jgi:hypothetical protein